MISLMTTKIVLTCLLSGYPNLPTMITGKLVMKTKKFYVIRIDNKDKTEFIEVTVKKNKCRK